MRVDALDHLAVKLQYETQHAVRRRVLGSKIDGEVARSFAHGGLALAQAQRRPAIEGSRCVGRVSQVELGTTP